MTFASVIVGIALLGINSSRAEEVLVDHGIFADDYVLSVSAQCQGSTIGTAYVYTYKVCRVAKNYVGEIIYGSKPEYKTESPTFSEGPSSKNSGSSASQRCEFARASKVSEIEHDASGKVIDPCATPAVK